MTDDSSIDILLLLSMIINLTVSSTTLFYQNDYEPRVFDHIPLNCYDCLSYRDIILTQLIDVPPRAFEHFHLGSRDTYMILNGQTKLVLQPFAFQYFVIQKPNQTLTITFAAPNSWLNITENTFNGLDLRPYSTLRIIVKFFYGCTFHKNSLSGIQMGEYSRLILDISSVTQIHFQEQITQGFNSSVDFFIARTDTIVFEPDSFSSLIINPYRTVTFHFELISYLHLKSNSFHSLTLLPYSSLTIYTIFINRLSIDSYTFSNMSLDSRTKFNFTIRTLGTCLCLKSYSFANLYTLPGSINALVLLTFNGLRGLSFFPHTFANLRLSAEKNQNQLKIISHNPSNDPNPIVNFASETFSSSSTATPGGAILFNFSSITVIRFENNALKTELAHVIYTKDVTLFDFSLSNASNDQTKLNIHFDNVKYIKWYSSNENNSRRFLSSIQFHFYYISKYSCILYNAPRSISWLFPLANMTKCNCPILFAYKYGQLDGQSIPCIQTLTGHETAREMNECEFDRLENTCRLTLTSLIDTNSSTNLPVAFDIDSSFIRQLFDRNYLSCSLNYSSFTSTQIIRSRFLSNLGLVIGVILAIFIVLLIIVMVLLNGVQYKMREYDESWTWRRNMSWTSLRRTLSQTSLRRSRRDLRNLNGNGTTSKSENQLDRLRYDLDNEQQPDSDDQELDTDIVESQGMTIIGSIIVKKNSRIGGV